MNPSVFSLFFCWGTRINRWIWDFFYALKWLGLSSELTYGMIGTDQKHERCPILAGLVGLNLKVATGDISRIPMYPH